MNQYIEQAIETFRADAPRYRRTNRYYRGEHDLNFATEKFENTFGALFREFALNLCPAICDAVKDKLRIDRFGIVSNAERGVRNAECGAPTTASPDHPADEASAPLLKPGGELLHDAMEEIWSRNRMAIRAGEVHKETLRNGDAYIIVWPNERGEVTIFPNRAETCTVVYDDEDPGRVRWAAKYWRTDDKRTRLNLFFPDRIEKYISIGKSETSLPEAKEFVYLSEPLLVRSGSHLAEVNPPANAGGSDIVPNPFGIVPVFHFANNADIGAFGQSELDAAIPVQDGLNKSVLDMLVAMEVCAFRQRWVAGIEIERDADGKLVPPFTSGVDTLWQTENPAARFGDFEAADLDQFLKVKDSFRIDIASVTGTPLYYLLPQMRGFLSGESLRKAETRFLAKVRDRQEAFGQVWADVMAFAMKMAGHGDVRLITNWEDPSPESERETLENLRLKKELGISTEQVLKEAGYGEIDVRRMTR